MGADTCPKTRGPTERVGATEGCLYACEEPWVGERRDGAPCCQPVSLFNQVGHDGFMLWKGNGKGMRKERFPRFECKSHNTLCSPSHLLDLFRREDRKEVEDTKEVLFHTSI